MNAVLTHDTTCQPSQSPATEPELNYNLGTTPWEMYDLLPHSVQDWIDVMSDEDAEWFLAIEAARHDGRTLPAHYYASPDDSTL